MKEVHAEGTKLSEGETLLRSNFTVTLLFIILDNPTVNANASYSIRGPFEHTQVCATTMDCIRGESARGCRHLTAHLVFHVVVTHPFPGIEILTILLKNCFSLFLDYSTVSALF